MAIISVSSSAKLDSLTWTTADSIYIYGETTLTIDADPAAKAGVNLVSTQGQSFGASLLFDARQIKHINVSNTTGMTYGKVITGGTSGATGYCIKVSTTGVIKYRSTSTAQFISGETITGTGISATTSSVPRVACMYVTYNLDFGIFPATISTGTSGNFETFGDWCELGTTNGTGTFTLPTDYEKAFVIMGCWIETSAGSGVYAQWFNKPTAHAFSLFGNTVDNGSVFTHAANGADLTFGNGTQGMRPPSGCKVRIPNMVFTNAATYSIKNVNTLSIQKTSGFITGTAYNIDIANTITIADSVLPASSAIKKSGSYTATNVIFNKDLANINITAGVSLLSCNNITITNCAVNTSSGVSLGNSMSFQDSKNILISGTKLFHVVNSQNHATIGFVDSENFTVANTNRFYGVGRAVNTDNARNGTIDVMAGTYPGVVLTQSSDIELTRVGGTISGSSNITIREAEILPFFSSPSSNIVISGSRTGVIDGVAMSSNQGASDIVVQNFKCNSFLLWDPDPVWMQGAPATWDYQKLKVKGLQGVIIGLTAINFDAIGAYDFTTYDCFNAAGTAGMIGCLFQKERTPLVFSVVAGTPRFTGDGDLFMPTLNDEVHITWDYFIKGHSSLKNLAATVRTSVASATPASTNITVYYDIDNGSGFSGTWKLATGANLSGETINVAGFKPKFKLVTTTASTSNFISVLYIESTTTQAAIDANLYPIRPTIATVTISPVVDNSEVRIYAAGTQTDIAGIENTSGGSFSYTYEHTADFNVDIQVMHNNYEYIKIFNVTLTDTDSTIPIQQVPDNLYFNP